MSEQQALEAVKDGAVSVADAVEFTGLGRTQLYDCMTAGQLRYFKAGSRRLILRSELQKFLADLVTASA